MAADYEDPSRYDDFPRVPEVLRLVAAGLPDGEVRRLELVFGLHELGRVPAEHASLLRWLAARHQLGLVANIWCEKSLWLRELERSGVHDLFRTMVFSSDYRSIKPSPVLFRRALDGFAVDRSRVVFVGDSLRCDIEGAKTVGLSTVWISDAGGDAKADHVVSSLLDLRHL
jgi:FMN phosphatase YigB (HAD superfamily)